MRSTIDIQLDGKDILFVQSGDSNNVVIVTKGDDSFDLDEAIVDRIVEIRSRRAA